LVEGGGEEGKEGGVEGEGEGLRQVREQVRRLMRLGLLCVEEEEKEGREGRRVGGREGGREGGRAYEEFVTEARLLVSRMKGMVQRLEAPWIKGLLVRLNYNRHFEFVTVEKKRTEREPTGFSVRQSGGGW
jgi:hypothetical protein